MFLYVSDFIMRILSSSQMCKDSISMSIVQGYGSPIQSFCSASLT